MPSGFPWREVLGVALGGAAGSLLRYGVSLLLETHPKAPFPFAILLVNVAGCFLIGLLSQAAQSYPVPEWLRITLATGVLGGLTTFSTFGLDTYRLAFTGEWLLSLANVAANLLLGLVAIGAGMMLVRAVSE